MRAHYLACLMACAGACASTLEPPPRKPNVISIEGISSEFGAMARRHAAAHAKWLIEKAPPPPKVEEPPSPEPDMPPPDTVWMPEETVVEKVKMGPGHVATDLCQSVEVVSNQALGFVLYRYRFADGGAMIVCNVSDVARGYSGVAMKPAPGTMTGSGDCRVHYDVDRPTGGVWVFEIAEPNDDATWSAAVYSDPDSDHDKGLVHLPCHSFPP